MKLATVPCDGRGLRWRKFVFTTIANTKKNYKHCTAAPSPDASQYGLNRQQQYRSHAKAERQDVDRRPLVNRFTAKNDRHARKTGKGDTNLSCGVESLTWFHCTFFEVSILRCENQRGSPKALELPLR
ncbi:MAG: hypothetical protein WBX14_06725 [Candidatus Udaeobacter sp.]